MEVRRNSGYRNYQYGTAAPKRNFQPRPQPRPQIKRRPKHQVRTYRKVEVRYVDHPVTAARKQNSLKVVLTVAAVFVMLFAVVLVKSYSSSINLENIAIQKEIDQLNDEVAKLNIEITAKCNIKNIANIAEKRLGMSFPANENVRFVEISQEMAEEADALDGSVNDSDF